MFSTLLSIALVAVILGAAAYFLIKQSSEKPKSGSNTGDINNQNGNDTSSTSEPTNNN